LFIGRGYVFDIATRSWFKQTVMQGLRVQRRLATRTIWGTARRPDELRTRVLLTVYEPVARRNVHVEVRAAARDDGRQVRVRGPGLREVVRRERDGGRHGERHDAYDHVPDNRQAAALFLFNERAEVLDVQVVPSAGTPRSNEAPSIEAVRIGFTTGHILPTG
jgi:hypothetical protein